MTRAHGFQGNGRITNGRCQHCGSFVMVQHGTYPGERWPRHLYWCDACNGYSMTIVLDDYCTDCRAEATEQPLYLIRVGGDCIHYHLARSGHSVKDIEAVKSTLTIKPQPVAVQMRMKF